MDCKQTLLAFALGVAFLQQPALAGGPVLEEPEGVTESLRGNWVLPVIIGGAILCAIACGGGDDDPAPVDPGPVCNDGTDC